MESFKDVMLSEPPSRYAAPPSIQPVSLESYKGILLCDRPSQPIKIGDSQRPFLPAGNSAGEHRYFGLQPTAEQRSRWELSKSLCQSAKASRNTAALSKHRRWLKSFCQAVKQMKMDQVEDQLKDSEKNQRIREKQGELRRARNEPPPCVSESTNQQPQEIVHQEQPKKESKLKKKPKWALTEDEALDVELSQHDDLLQFAKCLDFEKFINDYEVKEALSILRERVSEISGGAPEAAKEKNDDVMSEFPLQNSSTAVAASVKRKKEEVCSDPAHDSDWNGSIKVGDKVRHAMSTESLALAEKVLAQSESMRHIHTKQSLAKLLQDVTLANHLGTRGVTLEERTLNAAKVPTEVPLQPPAVVQVSEGNTGREANAPTKRVLVQLRNATDKTQNLPYLYRCPSL